MTTVRSYESGPSIKNPGPIGGTTPAKVSSTDFDGPIGGTTPAAGAFTGVTEVGGVLKENLLTNSGFGMWSNSEDLYTTGDTAPASGDGYAHDTETCDDDAVDDEKADWSETGGGAITFDTDIYDFDGSAANEYVHSAADFTALTAGHLYQLSISFSDEATAQTIQMGTFATGGGATGFTALGPDITTTGTVVAHTRVFVAAGTETRIGFKVTSNPASSNKVNWKDSLLHEVKPGIASATTKGPDGWNTTAAADLWREYAGSNVLASAPYGVKFTSTGTHYLEWMDGGRNTTADFYKKFYGRTVTMGAWIMTSTSYHPGAVRFKVKEDTVQDPSGGTALSTNSTSLQYIEATHTFGSDATDIIPFVLLVATGHTVYISAVTLVWGTGNGSGSYSAPRGEIINAEATIALTDYAADTVAADVTVNLQSQSLGMIPKGTKAVYGSWRGANSGEEKYLDMLTAASGVRSSRLWSFDSSDDSPLTVENTFRAICAADGTIYLDVEDGNWSAVTIEINAVEMR